MLNQVERRPKKPSLVIDRVLRGFLKKKTPFNVQDRLVGEAHLIQFELITEALDKSGIRYFSIHKNGKNVIGVFREEIIDKFKDFLTEAKGIHTYTKNSSSIKGLHGTSEFYCYFDLHFIKGDFEVGRKFAVKVEMWSSNKEGSLSFSGSGGGFTKLPNEIGASLDSADLKSFSALTSYNEHIDDPVDLVIMWVDGSDPKWLEKKNLALGKLAKQEEPSPNYFRNNNEISTSIRLILNFMPWIRDIYLVTDSQVPTLDKIYSDKVKLIDHSDFLPEYVSVPTFNRHVISAFLHRIPGISKRFIISNDDIFALRVVPKSCFMTRNGILKINPTSTGMSHSGVSGNSIPESARANAHRLISNYFEKNIYPFRLKHIPYILDRELMKILEENLKDEFVGLAASQFRNKSDFDPIYLHAFFAHESGKAILQGSLKYEYIRITSERLMERVEKAYRSGFDFLCLNDTQPLITASNQNGIEEALTFLDEIFRNEI